MRVTSKRIDEMVAKVNEAEGRPVAGWQRTNGENIANIGHLVADHAACYGGYRLEEIIEETGTVNPVFPDSIWSGRVAGKDLYNYLQGRLAASGVDA